MSAVKHLFKDIGHVIAAPFKAAEHVAKSVVKGVGDLVHGHPLDAVKDAAGGVGDAVKGDISTVEKVGKDVVGAPLQAVEGAAASVMGGGAAKTEAAAVTAAPKAEAAIAAPAAAEATSGPATLDAAEAYQRAAISGPAEFSYLDNAGLGLGNNIPAVQTLAPRANPLTPLSTPMSPPLTEFRI